ncbi:MAG: DNA mismatch repair endonuclease MutL [Ruminococcaceae bacterium]|nr:DNA mismatch repair endonuclease MutL [Oscillospiraceae bacterium]
MAEIRVLTQAVADKIAAGEVAERPSAVVKELVENSIDAGADRITVEIRKGGIAYISVEDNGKGIPFDEVETAFVRHATSKLREIDDLFEINTMGFRGEALASICAVSDVTVITKQKDAAEGALVAVNHGKVSKKETIACNDGTVMVVENLFASVPARMKFLKKDSTESGYVADVLCRIALSKPQIAFRYVCDGKEQFSTSGDGSLKNAILNIYGIDHAKGVLGVEHSENGVTVSGVVGKAELARGNRMRQTLFVNGRYIKNHVVSKIVEEAYRNVVMTGKFPFFVLDIRLSPSLVDVNVHPAKTEIKFANEKEIYDIVYRAVKNAIYHREETVVPEKTPAASVKVDTEKSISSPWQLVKPQDKKREETVDRRTVAQFLENTVPKHGEIVFNAPKTENPFRPDWEKEKIVVSKEETAPVNDISEVVSEETKSSENISVEKNEPIKLFADMPECTVEESFVVVGQVFGTYVIAQKGEKMFLVDQHAAHERKRFEILKKDYQERGVSGQLLLAPIVLDVDSSEIQVVKDNCETLKNMGFDIEEFGRNSVIIRETPFVSDEEDIKALAVEVISILADGRPSGLLSFEERLLDTVSCKYAIKANKKLSVLEMEVLLRDVEELEKSGITTCPHGRPIRIEFSKREIEKMFKRIV